MNPTPKWYTPVTILALLWNLMGCAAFISDLMLTPEDVVKMTAEMQKLYAAREAWAVGATAAAVWGGAIGSLGLILRRNWALPALLVSLLGLIVQDVGLFLVTDTVKIAGPSVVVLQGLVLAIAIGLLFLARRASSSAWSR